MLPQPQPVDFEPLLRRLTETRESHLAYLARTEDETGADDIEVATRRRVESGLSEVEAALERLKEGTYGVCIMCRQPISRERLDALPHAATCASCAGSGERRR